ncbi:hypothetical protein [uncultured Desulfosarcina sp.]|uniref:oxidoreductase n=1 Tax=uncultured Desulfosarcina sp. TaxID=218289 RepID=UPI0029C7D6B8|nr:hypothetical protein [uncultured Desulfosarcina sp.]
MTKPQSLFKSGRISCLPIRNRVVMPPLGMALDSAYGEITDYHIAYYEVRARGGVGPIVMEACLVEPTFGKSDFANSRIDDNRFIPIMHRLANAIHKHDTRIFVQMHHAGRQSNSALTGAVQIVAPSPVSSPVIGETLCALSLEEIADLEDRFVQGALRCKMAGMDGVKRFNHRPCEQQFRNCPIEDQHCCLSS